MLAVASPDHPVRVGEFSAAGLREKLKHATARAHRDLDARFGAYCLTGVDGYRRFLEASAAALLPLETALERSGVIDVFPDWPQRSRAAAIADDLGRIGGIARPLPPPAPLGRNEMLGAMYVLEGSRLGARYLLRAIADCGEPTIAEATRYLGHGSGLPLWRTFLAKLESEPVTSRDEADIISGARNAFAMFARAAGAGR
jgi:heme oxygenase (biliverdin-IX-beta and delta-forming)